MSLELRRCCNGLLILELEGSFLGNSKNKDADNKYDDEQKEPHPHPSVPDGAN
jgi:hypothetical protein